MITKKCVNDDEKGDVINDKNDNGNDMKWKSEKIETTKISRQNKSQQQKQLTMEAQFFQKRKMSQR
jgi:hypothetical protein